MATVSGTVGKEIVEHLIANGGRYDDDPVVVRIVEYNNQFDGGLAWGLIYRGEDIERYHNSPACLNPRTIFDHGMRINHG